MDWFYQEFDVQSSIKPLGFSGLGWNNLAMECNLRDGITDFECMLLRKFYP